MLMNTLTYNISHFSSVEIAILGILIALLNLRAFSLTAKTGLLYQLRDKLMIGLIPILLIGGLIMTNQLFLAIAAN